MKSFTDFINEMDLSRETPASSDIEDRRPTKSNLRIRPAGVNTNAVPVPRPRPAGGAAAVKAQNTIADKAPNSSKNIFSKVGRTPYP